ncbi:MAG TPA: SurA N-terminal domain-containing protein, partial [Gaiellaceae bacterium]|nr:SurA N-terminal domain-containing protein [Gaiellaceae bacterium]
MPFFIRSIGLVLALVLVLAGGGCGGDGAESGEVPDDAIAVVGEQEIPKAEFDRLVKQAERTFKARKQDFPQAGTPEYEQLKNSIVKGLVEQAQYEQGAEELGIEVSEEDVDKRLEELKQQFFQG